MSWHYFDDFSSMGGNLDHPEDWHTKFTSFSKIPMIQFLS